MGWVQGGKGLFSVDSGGWGGVPGLQALKNCWHGQICTAWWCGYRSDGLDEDKHSARAWFGLNERFDWQKARVFGPLVTIVATLIVCGLFFLAIIAAFKLLGAAVFNEIPQDGFAKFGLTGIIVAMIGAPFVVWRSVVAQRQVIVSELGLTTDRLNASVQGLGAVRDANRIGRNVTYNNTSIHAYETETEWRDSPKIYEDYEVNPVVDSWQTFIETHPNIEVRIGALFTLERLAMEDVNYHWHVMQIISAYIRENAREARLQPSSFVLKRPFVREDIQTALTVLGRRSADGKNYEQTNKLRLDLRNTNLAGANFEKGDFSGALLVNCRLEACLFRDTKLQGTVFASSVLNYSDFFRSDMTGAHLDTAIINQPTPTVGGMNDTINMANIRGISLAGADISAVDYLGTPEEMNTTYGTKDTILAEELEEQRQALNLRKLLAQIHKAEREGADEVLDGLKRTLQDSGFQNWSPYDYSDGYNGNLYRKHLAQLGLTSFPFVD